MKKIFLAMTQLFLANPIYSSDSFTVRDLIIQGSACDSEKSLGFIDRDIIRVLPSSFSVSFEDRNNILKSINCHIKFFISVDPGYQVSIYQDPLFGYSEMNGSSRYVFSTQGQFVDGLKTSVLLEAKKDIKSPVTKRFRVDTNMSRELNVWSDCNTSELFFEQDSSLTGILGLKPENQLRVSIDSAWVFRVVARKCLK